MSEVSTDGATAPKPNNPTRMAIIAYDGFDELDIVGPFEVFARAQALGLPLTTRIVTRTLQEQVRGSFGLTITPDAVFVPGDYDAILVPGGRWLDRGPHSAWAEVERGDWLPILAREHRAGKTLLSVCTGTMLLAHAGVLAGRTAATHHSARADLAATGVTVSSDRVVVSDDILTCGGVTSGIDLAVAYLQNRFGPASQAVAQEILDILEYPETPGSDG